MTYTKAEWKALHGEVDLRALDLKVWLYRLIAAQRELSAKRAQSTRASLL
jgi:hypothetical protein